MPRDRGAGAEGLPLAGARSGDEAGQFCCPAGEGGVQAGVGAGPDLDVWPAAAVPGDRRSGCARSLLAPRACASRSGLARRRLPGRRNGRRFVLAARWLAAGKHRLSHNEKAGVPQVRPPGHHGGGWDGAQCAAAGGVPGTAVGRVGEHAAAASAEQPPSWPGPIVAQVLEQQRGQDRRGRQR
jgi:hypothetical protein